MYRLLSGIAGRSGLRHRRHGDLGRWDLWQSHQGQWYRVRMRRQRMRRWRRCRFWNRDHLHPSLGIDADLEAQGRHQPPSQTQTRMQGNDDEYPEDHSPALEQRRLYRYGRVAQDRRPQLPERRRVGQVQGLDLSGLKSRGQRLLLHDTLILTRCTHPESYVSICRRPSAGRARHARALAKTDDLALRSAQTPRAHSAGNDRTFDRRPQSVDQAVRCHIACLGTDLQPMRERANRWSLGDVQ